MFSTLRAALGALICTATLLVTSATTASSAVAPTVTGLDITAPADFRASQIGYDRVEVTWSLVPNAQSYTVFKNGVSYDGIHDPGHTMLVGGLLPGKTYEFEVAAFASGEFGPRARVSVTTRNDNNPPSAPTGLREYFDDRGTSLGITWDPSADKLGVSGTYRILADGRHIVGGGAPASWLRLTDPYFGGLSCGTTYTFTVQAHGMNGTVSPESAPLSATTPRC